MSQDSHDSDFTPPELSEIAELLPAYEVLSFIAKGGMGAVYHARQKSLDRDVAIKILPRHFGEDASFRDSFEAEAKSMAKLNHPNLISIYDFGQIDGLLYIIMEMVLGKSLYHSAYGKKIDTDEAARITAEICRGLAHAHEHDILHRDIKPANILLDPNAKPKIGDFGLARPVGDHESDSAFGTPGYTAPEVIHNPQAVDESTDIYAVGAILYELLTGELPQKAYIPAASKVSCNPAFDRVIRKAMHPTPAMRYRSAEALAKDLEKIPTSNSQDTSRVLLRTSSNSKQPQNNTLITASGNTDRVALKVAGKDGDTPSTTPSAVSISTGSNVPFIRNIIIIIGLLAAIFIAWEGLKVVRAKRDAKNARIEQENADKKAEKEKRKEEIQKNNQGSAPDNPKITKPTPPPPKIETPMETLARLRPMLARGSRSEMPKKTVTDGNRARFFVAKPMSWHEARQFCERHGGHLAVFPSDLSLRKFSTKIPSDKRIWLGGGSAGDGEWTWVDGTPWNHKMRETSKASYVSVDTTGILEPHPETAGYPFYIEWMMDGSNPASLKEQLKRTASSLSESQPVFPAGSISYENRHFLLVRQSTDWKTARNMADLSGGHLAVASNEDESIWTISFVRKQLPPEESCWIGGYKAGNATWKWITGEPWKFANWDENAPDTEDQTTSANAISGSGGWNDFEIDEELPAFIIEWSKDRDGHKEIEKTVVQQDQIAILRAKCSKIISGITKDHEKVLANNIKGYEQELSVFKRSLPKGLQEAYNPGILEMRARVKNNRIPEDIPRTNMPEKLEEILDGRLDKQNRLDKQFFAKIEDLREKYRQSLKTQMIDLKKKGLTSRVKKYEEELEDTANDGQDFIDHIVQ